jgi:hypothetical protein
MKVFGAILRVTNGKETFSYRIFLLSTTRIQYYSS